MEMLQGVWKQHLRPRAVVGYGVKIFLPSPRNYVTRSPGLEARSESAVMCISQTLPNDLWIFLSPQFQQLMKIGVLLRSCFSVQSVVQSPPLNGKAF